MSTVLVGKRCPLLLLLLCRCVVTIGPRADGSVSSVGAELPRPYHHIWTRLWSASVVNTHVLGDLVRFLGVKRRLKAETLQFLFSLQKHLLCCLSFADILVNEGIDFWLVFPCERKVPVLPFSPLITEILVILRVCVPIEKKGGASQKEFR